MELAEYADSVSLRTNYRPTALEEVADRLELGIGIGCNQRLGVPEKIAKDLTLPGGKKIGRFYDNLPAIVGIRPAARVARPFEAIDHGRHSAGRKAESRSKLGGRQRPCAAKKLETAEIGAVHPEAFGSNLVEPIDFPTQATQCGQHRGYGRAIPTKIT